MLKYVSLEHGDVRALDNELTDSTDASLGVKVSFEVISIGVESD